MTARRPLTNGIEFEVDAFLLFTRAMFEEYDTAYYPDLKSTMITALARGLRTESRSAEG